MFDINSSLHIWALKTVILEAYQLKSGKRVCMITKKRLHTN
jgi:hypothetical protein